MNLIGECDVLGPEEIVYYNLIFVIKGRVDWEAYLFSGRGCGDGRMESSKSVPVYTRRQHEVKPQAKGKVSKDTRESVNTKWYLHVLTYRHSESK